MHRTINHPLVKIFLFSPVIFFLACSSKQNQSEEVILAKIGKKEISKKEFLDRSELTIRPNPFKGKETTLNNLICEKMLAIEAENNSQFLHNSVLQSRIKGIKEQLMRDRLYYEEAFNKVHLDSQEVRNVYRLSMREYELEFYTMHDENLAYKIETWLDSVPDLSDEMFGELANILGKKPLHKVNYKDQDDDIIHESLYKKPLDIGTVIGPLKLSNGEYIIMKVMNWTDYPLISGVDQQNRWNDVEDKLHKTEARKLWQSYLANLMNGKKIEFNAKSFKVLSDWAMESHLYTNNSDSLNFQSSEIPPVAPEINLDDPLFTIDNKEWTVEDFKKELMSHPLVYRTKNLNRNNFKKHFKLAIADMMRDHYLTRKAYKKSLDNREEIKKEVQMWKDAYLADFQKNSIINSAINDGTIKKDDKTGIQEFLESYILDLQKNYSDIVSINVDEFNKISLTQIDYFAFRPGVPYPAAVPGFPVLTSSENLDYIER